MKISRWLFASIFFFCSFTLIATGVYLTYGITLITARAVGVCATLLTALYWHALPRGTKEVHGERSFISCDLLVAIAIVLDVYNISTAWGVRTDLPLQTPWITPITAWFFALFAVASVLLIAAGAHAHRGIRTLGVHMHYVLTFGIALFAFRYGFGYDPLIHQTAESYIMQHGKIFPLQPFYIGQYALVAVLHFLSGIPTALIDRALVPLLAMVSLPSLALQGLRAWGLSRHQAWIGALLLPFFAYAEFTFTVPHNMTALLALWWALLLPLLGRSIFSTLLHGMIALTALAFHPLIGVPLLAATLFAHLLKRMPVKSPRLYHIYGYAAASLLIAGVIFAMFALYRVIQGLPPVASWEFWKHLDKFTILFRPLPIPPHTPWEVTALIVAEYALRTVLPLALIITLGFVKKIPEGIRATIFILATGLVLAIFFLSTMIELPGIVLYEQAEFALRLKSSLLIIVGPALLVVLLSTLHLTDWKRIVMSAVCGPLLAFSLYITYPQVNAVKHFIGWNVTLADYVGVHRIERDAHGERYLVLSDQTFSAAALQTLGFGHRIATLQPGTLYPYAISPSEFLFPYAQWALYTNLTPPLLAQLRAATGVDRVYIAVHSYWYRRTALEEEVHALGGKKLKIKSSVISVYRL